jgi:hypothetical protein
VINLPKDRETCLRTYGVWVDLAVIPCAWCGALLVTMYECPDRDLKEVASKWIEILTWPDENGLWFRGEDHSFQRCLAIEGA